VYADGNFKLAAEVSDNGGLLTAPDDGWLGIVCADDGLVVASLSHDCGTDGCGCVYLHVVSGDDDSLVMMSGDDDGSFEGCLNTMSDVTLPWVGLHREYADGSRSEASGEDAVAVAAVLDDAGLRASTSEDDTLCNVSAQDSHVGTLCIFDTCCNG
jgi:hypothetical protein